MTGIYIASFYCEEQKGFELYSFNKEKDAKKFFIEHLKEVEEDTGVKWEKKEDYYFLNSPELHITATIYISSLN